MTVKKLYYSIREASSVLSLSQAEISRRLKTGEIKAFKSGSRVLIPSEAIESLVFEPYPIEGKND